MKGLALVGIGSFAFHATLTYTAQLADELPMIYAVTVGFVIVFDAAPGFDLKTSKFGATLTAVAVLFDVRVEESAGGA